jgi:hypothetical protein
MRAIFSSLGFRGLTFLVGFQKHYPAVDAGATRPSQNAAALLFKPETVDVR